MKVWVKGLEYVTGGLEGQCLDAINGNLLSDGDMAIVRSAGRYYLYELDHDNSSAEASPWIIRPDKNAGTKRWILQDAASLSYWTMARAYLNTAQTGLVSGATTKVLLDAESFDIGGLFASNKYTAAVSGYYQINWNAYLRSDGGTITQGVTYLYKDGAAASYGSYFAGSDILSTGGDLLYVAAGSYLELYAVGVTSSSTWKISSSTLATYMTVYLVARE